MSRILAVASMWMLAAGLSGAMLMGVPAHAQNAGRSEHFIVELRVIEGTPFANGGGEKQIVDPKLATFAKDLKALPFKQLKLLDAHTTGLGTGERISLEIPNNSAQAGKPNAKRRFLQVAAHGRQPGGKLRFQLTIDALKFDTLVAVPDGGTIFVAVPKTGGPAMLFAFTARTER